jgi:fibronectin-binding autotransporter adhesin
VVAPTDDTVYNAVTSSLIVNGQQSTDMVLDRIGNRMTGAPDPHSFEGLYGVLDPVSTTAPDGASEPSSVLQDAWFRATGGFAGFNGQASTPGFFEENGGFLAGYDRQVTPNGYLGVAAGYTRTIVDEDGTGSDGTVDTARLNAYGGVVAGAALLSGTIGYAHDFIDTQRQMGVIGAASENHGGDEFSAAAQGALPIHIQDFTFTPQVGLQFLSLSEGSFLESGAGSFDLSSSAQALNSLQPFVGASLSRTIITSGGAQIVPEIRLAYSRETLSDVPDLTVFATDGTPFTVVGVKPARDMIKPGAGLTVSVTPNLSLFANYDAVIYVGDAIDQDFSAGMQMSF